jgi:hypothetical protein
MAENRAVRRTVINIMLEISPHLNPAALAQHLRHRHWYVVRNVVWLLGRMGSGTENMLLEATSHSHEKVRTEALRSLAMVATPKSIDYLFRLLERGDRMVRRTAVEFVGTLPPALLEPHLIKMLSNREFTKRDAMVSMALIDALTSTEHPRTEEILTSIAGMRFLLWNWNYVRVGMRARKALRRRERGNQYHRNAPEEGQTNTNRETGEQG